MERPSSIEVPRPVTKERKQAKLAPQTKAIKLTNQKGKQIHAVRKRACPSGLTLAEDVVRRLQANQQAQLTETLKQLCQHNNQHQQQL